MHIFDYSHVAKIEAYCNLRRICQFSN